MLVRSGIACGSVCYLVDISMPDYIMPIEETFVLVGGICITLAGMLPMMGLISKVLKPIVNIIGKRSGLNHYSIIGLMLFVVSAVAVLGIYDEMDNRGKVMIAGFGVSISCLLGAHLGFVRTICPEALIYSMLGKIVSASLALIITMFITRKRKTPIA